MLVDAETARVNVALQRWMEELRPLIQSYAEAVQLAQGELSKAMILQQSAPQENQWNIVQHELALLQQNRYAQKPVLAAKTVTVGTVTQARNATNIPCTTGFVWGLYT